MIRLGIVAALRDEARLLTDQPLALRQDVDLGEQAVLRVSGMGPEHARAAGEQLISNGATAILSWGTAAALDPALESGTLLLPDEVLSAQGQLYRVDKEWQASVLRSLSSALVIHQGLICESPEVLDSVAGKAGLYAQAGCAAVDMESAALASLAAEKGIPFLSLRFIVDTADMALPKSLMVSLDADGQVRMMRLLGQLVLHPADIPPLIRLGSAFSRAKKSMRLTVERLGVNMAVSGSKRPPSP